MTTPPPPAALPCPFCERPARHWSGFTYDYSCSADLVDFVQVDFCAVHQPFHKAPVSLAPLSHAAFNPGNWTLRQEALSALEAADTCIGWLLELGGLLGYDVCVLSDNDTDTAIGGDKGGLSDACLVVPMIWRGDGIPAGTTSNLLTQATDLRTTILTRAGLAHNQQDGISFATDLTGVAQNSLRQYAVLDTWLGAGSVPANVSYAIAGARWKLIRENGGDRLYDLLSDPEELVNLWDGSPTVNQIVQHDRLVAQIPV